jgi:hypothetical protein
MSKKTPTITPEQAASLTPEELADLMGLDVEKVRQMTAEDIRQSVLAAVPPALHEQAEQAEQQLTNARRALSQAEQQANQIAAELLDKPSAAPDLPAWHERHRVAVEQQRQVAGVVAQAEQRLVVARQQRQEALEQIKLAYQIATSRSVRQAQEDAQRVRREAEEAANQYEDLYRAVQLMRFA